MSEKTAAPPIPEGFKRREFHERLDLTEFHDPTGQYVGAFAIVDNPAHPSSLAALTTLYGYRPADPDNPEHRRMFPKAMVKDGFLVNLAGEIAMIYPKAYYDEYHAERQRRAEEPVLGTGNTKDADIRDPQYQEALGAAVAAVSQSTTASEKAADEKVEAQVLGVITGQASRATNATAQKVESKSPSGASTE